MCACDHLLGIVGGKVYMDKTFVSVVRCAKKYLKVHRHIIVHIYIYLKHEMMRTNSLHMHLIRYIFNTSVCMYATFYFRSSFK
jgi:hypothetical protein